MRKPVPRSNIPREILRWNIEKAGIEFGKTTAVLTRALAEIHAAPDEFGCYSTAQICEALFGDMHAEKLATQRESHPAVHAREQHHRGVCLESCGTDESFIDDR
jgi:hypothetical protein